MEDVLYYEVIAVVTPGLRAQSFDRLYQGEVWSLTSIQDVDWLASIRRRCVWQRRGRPPVVAARFITNIDRAVDIARLKDKRISHVCSAWLSIFGPDLPPSALVTGFQIFKFTLVR